VLVVLVVVMLSLREAAYSKMEVTFPRSPAGESSTLPEVMEDMWFPEEDQTF